MPQRRNGKLRVAAILKAGEAVIVEKGYEAATMAEIAARSNTKIGSLYRFFPNKEVLANALIAHYHEGVHNAFDELDSKIQSLSISALADFLLDLMVDLHKGAGPTMKRLLEIPEVLSVKRGEFSRSIHKHIVRTLTLRSPGLTSDKALPKAKRRVYAMTLSVSASIAAGCRGQVVRRLALGHSTKKRRAWRTHLGLRGTCV